mmetsp:Transcript_126971/g.201381  ORF Transcript_126971/g.201381 Transcript_126971/m.201381 type:complete len:566 (-) Transcript_126971:124-1821(-)
MSCCSGAAHIVDCATECSHTACVRSDMCCTDSARHPLLEACTVTCVATKVSLRRDNSLGGSNGSSVGALAWLAPQKQEELRVEIALNDSSGAVSMAESRMTERFVKSKSIDDASQEDVWVCQTSPKIGGPLKGDQFVFDVKGGTELGVRVLFKTIAWLKPNSAFEQLASVRFRVDTDIVPAVLADGELCLPLVQNGLIKGKIWLAVSLHSKGDHASWSHRQNNLIHLLNGHRDGITSCAVFPTGDKMLTVSQDGVGCVWSSTGALLTKMQGHSDSVASCAISFSGDNMITVSLDGSCIIWSSSGARLKSIQCVGYFAVFPSGERVHLDSTGKHDNVMATLGEQLPIQCGHTDSMVSCAIFPSGQQILTAAGDGIGIIWSLSGEPMVRLEGHAGALTDCAIFPCGEKIVTASRDRTGIIWLKNGDLFATLIGHSDAVLSCAVFPAGDKLITTSSDLTAIIWTAAGENALTLRGHSETINSCAVFPSGEHVITASEDKTAMIWSARSGALSGVLRGHRQGITACSVWPSGRRALTVSEDRDGIIWPVALYVSRPPPEENSNSPSTKN